MSEMESNLGQQCWCRELTAARGVANFPIAVDAAMGGSGDLRERGGGRMVCSRGKIFIREKITYVEIITELNNYIYIA